MPESSPPGTSPPGTSLPRIGPPRIGPPENRPPENRLPENGAPENGVEFSIGQVAERTGLSVHALRLYEREGLLTGELRRDASGHRVYREWDVQWLANCTKFRASGMPLATIRRLAELVGEGPGNECERLELLREHRQRVLDRIAELHDCLDLISNKVTAYEEAVGQGTASALWSA